MSQAQRDMISDAMVGISLTAIAVIVLGGLVLLMRALA